MRLRGGRDLNPQPGLRAAPPDPHVTWLPGVLSKGVRLRLRLRLRLDRQDGRGRGCWQLVDLGAEPEPDGRGLEGRVPEGGY